MQSCLFQSRQVYSAKSIVTLSLVSVWIASSQGSEHRRTQGTNLDALFIMQVPPFKAVLMNTIPNVVVISCNMAEVLRHQKLCSSWMLSRWHFQVVKNDVYLLPVWLVEPIRQHHQVFLGISSLV